MAKIVNIHNNAIRFGPWEPKQKSLGQYEKGKRGLLAE